MTAIERQALRFSIRVQVEAQALLICAAFSSCNIKVTLGQKLREKERLKKLVKTGIVEEIAEENRKTKEENTRNVPESIPVKAYRKIVLTSERARDPHLVRCAALYSAHLAGRAQTDGGLWRFVGGLQCIALYSAKSLTVHL